MAHNAVPSVDRGDTLLSTYVPDNEGKTAVGDVVAYNAVPSVKTLLRASVPGIEGKTAVGVTAAHNAAPSVDGRGLLLYTLVSDVVDEIAEV